MAEAVITKVLPHLHGGSYIWSGDELILTVKETPERVAETLCKSEAEAELVMGAAVAPTCQ